MTSIMEWFWQIGLWNIMNCLRSDWTRWLLNGLDPLKLELPLILQLILNILQPWPMSGDYQKMLLIYFNMRVGFYKPIIIYFSGFRIFPKLLLYSYIIKFPLKLLGLGLGWWQEMVWCTMALLWLMNMAKTWIACRYLCILFLRLLKTWCGRKVETFFRDTYVIFIEYWNMLQIVPLGGYLLAWALCLTIMRMLKGLTYIFLCLSDNTSLHAILYHVSILSKGDNAAPSWV